jgi:tetratricopeptide (TPR) repeat protein
LPRLPGLTWRDHLTKLYEVAKILQEEGKTTSALEVYRTVLARQQAAFGNGHPDTMSTLHSMALTMKASLYREEAVCKFREALLDREIAFGKDHLDTLETLEELAYVLEEIGDDKESEPLLREALAGYLKQHGEVHISTLRVLVALARILEYRDKGDKGNEIFREVWARTEQMSDSQPDKGRILFILAKELQSRSRYLEAEETFSKALALQEACLGTNHRGTLKTLCKIAGLLYDKNNFKEADQVYRDILDREHQVDESMLANISITQYLLAKTLSSRMKHEEAANNFRTALADVDINLKETHADTPEVLQHLARALKSQRKYTEAKEIHRGVLARDGVSHKMNVSDRSSAYFRLGHVLLSRRRFQDAVDFFQFALEVQEIAFGRIQTETTATRCDLEYALALRGRETYGKAEKSFLEAVTRNEGLHEMDVFNWSNMNSLLDHTMLSHRFEEAALGAMLRCYTIDKKEILLSRLNLQEAEKVCQKNLHQCEKQLGKHCHASMMNLAILAGILEEQGKAK